MKRLAVGAVVAVLLLAGPAAGDEAAEAEAFRTVCLATAEQQRLGGEISRHALETFGDAALCDCAWEKTEAGNRMIYEEYRKLGEPGLRQLAKGGLYLCAMEFLRRLE